MKRAPYLSGALFVARLYLRTLPEDFKLWKKGLFADAIWVFLLFGFYLFSF